jgi:hypothetical protein
MVGTDAIQQIDAVLARYRECLEKSKGGGFANESIPPFVEVTTRLKAAIDRLSPRGSEYRKSSEEVLKGSAGRFALSRSDLVANSPMHQSGQLAGILTALRSDYEAGYMQTVSELIHADLFSDFLEMAVHLLEEGYKDPAAVLGGSTLEEHLRKLCQKHGLPAIEASGKPLKADRLNADLKAANVYSTLDQKQVTAWQDLRNKAAHGHYNEYSKPEVGLMISGIQNFIARNPA